ncbi:MAG TPA: hypothetical protein PK129_02055 [Cellvibrionaceae bacterium]|nr:hypothetical protein [Cellvibrionaceae bacterium]
MGCKLFLGRAIWVRLFGFGVLSAVYMPAADAADSPPSTTTRGTQGAEQLRLFASFDSVTYAENVSIDAWMDDLHTDDTSPGENAFTRNFSEWGVAYGQMSFAGFLRQDYYLHFSQDTFDLVYQDKNKIPYDTSRRYDIHLDVAHVQIHGAKVGYDFVPLNNLQTRIEFNVFDAEEVLFGELNGYLAMTNGKIKGDLLLDYNYTEDVVLDRPKTPPASGHGRSIDLELWWQPTDAINLHVLAEDIYSQIKWSQTPFTEATITTVRTTTNKDGTVRRMPSISGREYFREVTQTIPRHFQADVGFEFLNRWQIELSQERIDDLAFNRLMARCRIGSQLKIGLGYDASAQAPRLELSSSYFNLLASADSTDGKKAKFIALSAGLRVAF